MLILTVCFLTKTVFLNYFYFSPNNSPRPRVRSRTPLFGSAACLRDRRAHVQLFLQLRFIPWAKKSPESRRSNSRSSAWWPPGSAMAAPLDRWNLFFGLVATAGGMAVLFVVACLFMGLTQVLLWLETATDFHQKRSVLKPIFFDVWIKKDIQHTKA